MKELSTTDSVKYKHLMDSYIFTYVDVIYTLDITEIEMHGSTTKGYTTGGYTNGGYTRTYTVDKVVTKRVTMRDPDTGVTKEFIIEESTPEERQEWIPEYWVPERIIPDKFHFEKNYSGNHFLLKNATDGKLVWDFSGYSYTKESKYHTYLSAQSGMEYRMKALLNEIKSSNLAEPLYPEIQMSDIQFHDETRSYQYEKPVTPTDFERIPKEEI